MPNEVDDRLQLAKLAAYSGDPWIASHPYFARAEGSMDASWTKHIWPFIKGCDFGRVVELGCGHGRNSAKLLPLADAFLGVDIQPSNIEVCRQRFANEAKATFFKNNGYDLADVPNDWATLIYAFDTMVNFEPEVVQAYLVEIHRALQVGGCAFLHHSNYTGGRDWHKNPAGRNYLSVALMRELAARAGLTVLEQKVIDWSSHKNIDGLTLLEKPLESARMGVTGSLSGAEGSVGATSVDRPLDPMLQAAGVFPMADQSSVTAMPSASPLDAMHQDSSAFASAEQAGGSGDQAEHPANATQPETSASQLVSQFWGAPRKPGIKWWLAHPIVKREANLRISGDPDVGWLDFVRKTYLPEPASKTLSLACGFGGFERHLVQNNFVHDIKGLDISEGAIDSARKRAAQQGLSERIDYEVADLNSLSLAENSLNVIWISSAAHHIYNLENLFANCARGLTKGGLVILNDYIGPSRFQAPPKIVKIINDIFQMLPDRYCVNLFDSKTPPVIKSWKPPSMAWFEKYDPSEAVRSSEIIPVMERYFKIELFRPYGGAILHFLLNGIAGNFDDQPESEAILRLLVLLERQLEDCGQIQSDFAVVVARPK